STAAAMRSIALRASSSPCSGQSANDASLLCQLEEALHEEQVRQLARPVVKVKIRIHALEPRIDMVDQADHHLRPDVLGNLDSNDVFVGAFDLAGPGVDQAEAFGDRALDA